MNGVRAARIDLYGRMPAEWEERDRAALGRLLARLNHDMERVIRTSGTP